MDHKTRIKEKRSANAARKLLMTQAKYGRYGCRSASGGLPSEEDVKSIYREHGYNFSVVVEQLRDRRAWVPLLETRELNSFTIGVPPGGRGGIRVPGKDLITFEGESGHVAFHEYLEIFEHAVEELHRSIDSMNYRVFLSCISDGVASLEAYINYMAKSRGGPNYVDSKQKKTSFEDKVKVWIPEITGNKMDISGDNWRHFTELQEIRHERQAHPKTGLYGTSYSEFCRQLNLFRTGIAGLLLDLHIVFGDLAPPPIIHTYFLPDIQYVVEFE